ncbi:MAG: peptidoglycan DD-metalloendopeptidase family protein [Halothermotrichaceae bacterium]
MGKNKKYWFKLDKDKIKMQLKDIGKKLYPGKKKYRNLIVIFIFFVLIGTGFAIFYNDSSNQEQSETNILLESLDREETEEDFSLNYGPELDESDISARSDNVGKESDDIAEESNNSIEAGDSNRTAVEEEQLPSQPAEEGVVTEAVQPLNNDRQQQMRSLIKPVSGQLLQEPGWYYHSVFDDWRYLYGIKISGNSGDIVMAAADGKVVSVSEDEYKGIMVTVDHQNGWKTEYGHLQRASVSPNETVGKGQEIGRIGLTGIVSQPALYFSLQNEDGYINPLNYFEGK